MITTKILKDSVYNGHRVTTFELEYPRYIHSELMTHRCLVGDTLLHFDLPKGGHQGGKRVYTMSIKDYYTKWTKGVAEHLVGSMNKDIDLSAVDKDKTYTAKELANVLGYKSPSNIRCFCRSGRLEVLNPNKSKTEDYLIKGAAYLKIRENYGLRSFSIKDRLKEMQLRCCNTSTHFIEHTHITDIWEVGQKEVFEVKTKSGKSILATADHPFYIGNGVYAEVKDLHVGSFVYIESKGKAVKQDPNTYNKRDGQWVQVWIRQNKDSIASRQANKCFDCQKQLPAIFDIHHVIPRHIDPTKSFDLSNVVALCPSCHRKRHEIQDTYNHNGAFLYAKPDEIISITSKGTQTVYDLSVESSEHNFVANGFVVHNCFSRNCASSRAIPLQRMIELIKEHPVVPIWTKNQKGMQGELLNPLSDDAVSATHIWYIARDEAIRMANALASLGIHKQNANRLLEPFQTMKTILTGTQFNNFFKLRCHKAAMPEIQKLAEQMHTQYEQSVPKALWPWEWHTPYVNGYDCNDPEATERAKKISVSCCAQVSYRKLDETPEKALQIFNKLIQGDVIHASAFEHVCRPLQPGEEQLGNLIGFRQYRHDIEQERNYNSLE